MVNIVIIAISAILTIGDFGSPIIDALTFFYAGGLAAIVARACNSPWRNRILARTALLFAGVLPVAFALADLSNFRHASYLFLLAWTPALVLAVPNGVSASSAVQRIVEGAGNLTYASYLLHFPLQIAIALLFSAMGKTIPMYSSVFFCAFVGITLLMAWLSYRYFELPVQSWLRRRLSWSSEHESRPRELAGRLRRRSTLEG